MVGTQHQHVTRLVGSIVWLAERLNVSSFGVAALGIKADDEGLTAGHAAMLVEAL